MSKKISELTAAGALTGTELVEVVQSSASRRTTAQAIADLAGSGISGLTTNRVPYATSGTTLGDDSALTWDATNNSLTVNSARIHTSNHADNVFVGNGAGNFTNSLFGSNIGIGSNALDALTTGNSNIGIGKDALGAHQTGSGNVAIGVNALAAVVSTISNVAIGAGALSITTGSRNIAIGLNAGDNITTASNAVIIGDQLDAPSATTDGQLSIQNIIFGTGNTATGTTVSTGNIGIGVAAPAAKLDVTEDTVGSAAFKVSSSATNDDPGFTIYQNRVATTDATVTTIHTVAIPATTTVAINGWVVARRTGGSSGTAEDGAAYEFKAVYKNVSGTATIIGASTITAIGEDQAGWDVTLVPSSSNVLIRVTGAANNNITWHLSELKLMSVGS